MKSFRDAFVTGILICGGFSLASTAIAARSEPSSAGAEFTQMDSNNDQRVSADEHAAGAKRMFETMDANKDDKVTAAEMQAAHQRVTGRKARSSDMSAADKIKVVDTDGDGVLTAEEHRAGSRAMFERMDTNRDGFLSSDELAAGHARMLKQRPR